MPGLYEDRTVGIYILDLFEAHGDCERKLTAVGKLVTPQED